MKLRVRLSGRTDKVEIPSGNLTIGLVKESVGNAFRLDSSNFELSLNGREVLDGNQETLVSGLVSGDLLHIILTNRVQEDVAEPPQEESNRLSTRGIKVDHPTSQTNKESCSNFHSTSTRQKPVPKGAIDNDGSCKDGSGKFFNKTQCCGETVCDISPTLRSLYFKTKPETMCDALFIVLHVLMLEAGFKTEENETNSEASSSNSSTSSAANPKALSVDDVRSATNAGLPHDWRSRGYYKVTYCHPACEGAACMMTCVPLGQVMLVRGVTNGKTQLKLHLTPSDYTNVPSVDGQHPMYTNLSELSILFKDEIAYPIILKTRAELGLYKLLPLMPEMQLCVMRFLDVGSLLKLSQVCQHFHTLAADPSLWKNLLLADFHCSDTNADLVWKELYKQKYKIKMEVRRENELANDYHRRLYELPNAGRFMPPAPRPIYPPGYRGGHYDLDPFESNRQHPTASPFIPPLNRDPLQGPSAGMDPLFNPLRMPNRRDPLGSDRRERFGTRPNSQRFPF